MRIFSNRGELEIVTYTFKELKELDGEYEFCETLYKHTEGREMDKEIYKQALQEVNECLPYSITDEDDPLNKIRSWIDCKRYICKFLDEEQLSRIGSVEIGFEYHLKKRWVDAIIVSRSRIDILEFKSGMQSDEITIKGYVKQLRRYYNLIRRSNEKVVGMINDEQLTLDKHLIFTSPQMIGKLPEDDTIISGAEFVQILDLISAPASQNEFEDLLNERRYMDPSITGALASLIKNGIVDYVVKDNANVELCNQIIQEVLGQKETTLGIIFVKGGPGTGKTGTAFTLLEKCLNNNITNVQYVTGNGNLESYFTSIVEHTIEKIKAGKISNPIFERLINEGQIDSLEGLGEHLIGHIDTLYDPHQACKRSITQIHDQVLLVDEAQRLWNSLNIALRTKKERGEYKSEYTTAEQQCIYGNDYSEAYLLIMGALIAAQKTSQNKCLVLFIGNGQEINSGEEDGEKDVISSICRIQKYINQFKCPVKLKLYVSEDELENEFVCHGIDCASAKSYRALTLVNSQRNDLGDPKLEIVKGILENTPFTRKHQTGYEVYNTFEDIKRIVTKGNVKPFCEEDESYGVVVASYNIDSTKGRQYLLEKTWLQDKGRDLYNFFCKKQCNDLDSFVTQFGCQGLEFDDCIMIWGDTLKWNPQKNDWEINEKRWPDSEKSKGKSRYGGIWMHVSTANELIRWKNREKNLRNPLLDYKILRKQFVINAYRVLLTRARETTYIYVEDKNTFEHLKQLLQ
ncbi:MAG: DNA/RNA helicase domain-containing protein [Lachnospiraceae bacterium]